MKKNILFGLRVLVTVLLIGITQSSYAQMLINNVNSTNGGWQSDGNEIFIGEYTLDFKGTDEAKLTINIPNGFSHNNFVYYSIQPFLITHSQYLGSTMEFWVKARPLFEETNKIYLIIETNVENHYGIVHGYYFLVAHVNLMNLKQ